MPFELNQDQRLFVNLYTSFYDQMNAQVARLHDQIHVLTDSMNQTRNMIQNIYMDSRNIHEPQYTTIHEPDEPHLSRMREVSLMAQETTRYLFSDIVRPLNTECPISLEPFEPNTEVVQINRCGHIFNRRELQHWFENNTRCPTCRTELRQQPTQTTDQIMTTLFYDLIFPSTRPRNNNNHQT